MSHLLEVHAEVCTAERLVGSVHPFFFSYYYILSLINAVQQHICHAPLTSQPAVARRASLPHARRLRSACSRRRAWAAQRQRPPRAQALLESEGLRLRTENTAFVAASAWLAQRGDDAAAAAALAPLLRFPCMTSAFLIDAVPQARPRSGARGGARRPAAAP